MALFWLKLCSIFLAFKAIQCIECQECLSTRFESTKALMSKGFNVQQLTRTNDCSQGSDTTQTCEQACVVAMTTTDQEDITIRGCADTLITASQWASLQMTAEEAPETCKMSYFGAMGDKAPAEAKICFCKTDKCNKQLWQEIKATKTSQSLTATFLGLILLSVILLFVT